MTGHEGRLGCLRGVVVDGDVGVGPDGQVTLVLETQHSGGIEGRFLHEFRQTQHVKLHKRQPLGQNDIARNAAAVRGDCVDNERTVISLGLRERNARQRRIDVEAAADVTTGFFPKLESFLSCDQIRIAARVVNHEGLLGQQGRANAVSIFRESEVTQAVARDLRLNLAVGPACQACAVLGRNIAFAKDVRVRFEQVNGDAGFYHIVFDSTSAVGVDVRQVQRIAVSHFDGLDHAFDVGAVLGRAGVPSDVSAAFQSSLDEFGRYGGSQRIVAAEELDAQSTLFK